MLFFILGSGCKVTLQEGYGEPGPRETRKRVQAEKSERQVDIQSARPSPPSRSTPGQTHLTKTPLDVSCTSIVAVLLSQDALT
jgi:hypothetical protein